LQLRTICGDQSVSKTLRASFQQTTSTFFSYKCSVHGINVTEDNTKVGKITGPPHLDGKSFDDVNEVWYWTERLDFMPRGMGNIFKNLVKVWVSYETKNLHLKSIKRLNFENMLKLEVLVLYHNDIEMIASDALFDLPELNHIDFQNNKITQLSRNLLMKNVKLEHVDFSRNLLTSLHKDLFKKNPLLKVVSFKDNKLAKIHVDFIKFYQLTDFDLSGNVCIDGRDATLKDLQAKLYANCL